ncbi:MAG: TetR/AcrR family transcriptional regulator [Actinomycetota bacterium]
MPSPSTASQTKRKRGRPRSFDEIQVLDRSIDVFWQRGYRDVTTRDLEREIGISQSSIYNAFGSKEGLYSEVVGRYRHRLETELLPSLEQPTPGADSLLAFIDASAEWVGNPARPGCLMLSIDAEQKAAHDHLVDYRARLQEALRAAVSAFTTDEDAIARRTTMLEVMTLGLCTAARTNGCDKELQRMVDAITTQIRIWADPGPLL